MGSIEREHLGELSNSINLLVPIKKKTEKDKKTLPKQTVFLLRNQNCYTESKYEPHNNESVNTDLMEPVLKILCCNSTKFEQQKKRTTKFCICFSNSGPTTTAKPGGRLH